MSALPAPTRRGDSLAPAFFAALCLHLAFLAMVVFLHAARPPPPGDVTPITLVAHGPMTNSRPAELAPRVQAAQAEQPPTPATLSPPAAEPPAPVEPSPAPPRPVKAQPVPRPAPVPAPTPKPKPTRPQAASAVLAPAKAVPAGDTFLEHLAQTLPASRSPPRPASGTRGSPQPETDLARRIDAGQGVSQSDLQGLQQLLERLWNPNCAAPGADQLVIPVRFSIDGDGHVTGKVVERGAAESAAGRRAIDAIHEAEPYQPAYRNNTFTVKFDAQKACAGRDG